MKTKRQIFQTVTDMLTLSQYKQIMFGDMTYNSKFERVKGITKSKKIHALCDEGIRAPISLDALQIDNLNRAARGELIGE